MGWCQCQLPAPGMAPVERDGPDARMRSRACTGRQRLGVGTGSTEKLLGDPEQEDAELEALPTRLAKPVSAGAAAAGATVPPAQALLLPQMLRAPSLLLCQAGSAAVPPGTRPASLCAPGRDPHLQ